VLSTPGGPVPLVDDRRGSGVDHCREINLEGAARPGLAVNFHNSVMSGKNSVDHREPESRAFSGGLGGKEGSEDTLEGFRSSTRVPINLSR